MTSDNKDEPNRNITTHAQGLLFGEVEWEGDSKNGSIAANNDPKRKLQVCNGYTLQFDQLSRVLSAIWDRRDSRRITRNALVDITGLPDRQIASIVSIGSAIGLIKSIVQAPTRFGALVATHDIFFERTGTLEWCHYRGAGSPRNLVWYDVFNRLLPNAEPMTHPEWNVWFRRKLEGQYSDRTMRKVVQEEVHFVIDAYLEQKLSRLGLFDKRDSGKLQKLRYLQIDHVMLSAMLYDFIEKNEGRTYELEDLARLPGSPARVFGIDAGYLRGLVEVLHDNGWLRYETTHNLDQLRLKPGYHSTEFLASYYEHREPMPNDKGGGGRHG